MTIRKFIDVDRVRQLLLYDEITGELRWKNPYGKACNNDVAGSIPHLRNAQKPYRVVRIDGVAYQAHRLIFAIMNGSVPDEIDHINGDGLDNRWCNLRACTRTQNSANRRKKSGTLSPYKGVTFFPKGLKNWRARIIIDRREIFLGSYKTQEEAAAAYQTAASQHFGQFARSE